jgi:hypothetical protein
MTIEDYVVLVTSEGMGKAETGLQRKLLATYFTLLMENGTLPKAVCFYTDGVKLVVEGSPVLPLLQELEARGVRLILCQTCLDFFGLRDQVRVGIVGGMGDIIAAQMLAPKVLTI